MVNGNSEQLTVHTKPRALLQLIETQPPLVPDGVTVERFTTKNSKLFEKHTAPNGAETWFKVTRGKLDE